MGERGREEERGGERGERGERGGGREEERERYIFISAVQRLT